MGSIVCTGTLLNDTAQDQTPYFLTANHCVPTQTVAQTVEVYWFYQTTSCNSGVLRSDWVHQAGGANLLATQSSNDFSLLRLVNNAPAGAWFSGWTSGIQSTGTGVFGLHHPDGFTPPDIDSYLRRASGTITSTNANCLGLVNGYRTDWTSGTTEPGSSGSGLWNSSGYLVGVLSCGPIPATCNSPDSWYSKFANFYSQIQPYINPQRSPAIFQRRDRAGRRLVLSPVSQRHALWLLQPTSLTSISSTTLTWASSISSMPMTQTTASTSTILPPARSFTPARAPSLYLYDFSLNAWLYYLPDVNNPGRYTHNPRWFYNFATGQWITL